MRVLCIQGIHSSAGTSTVVANTARTLKELGQDVLVFDLNPNNLLRLHFNMDWQNPAGWALNMSKKNRGLLQLLSVSKVFGLFLLVKLIIKNSNLSRL